MATEPVPEKNIVQVKVTLLNTDPPVWRRLVIPLDYTFFDLHHIIQIAVGWTNYYDYEFTVNGVRIGIPDEEPDIFSFGDEHVIDSDTVVLGSVLALKGLKFRYTYDPNEAWIHEVAVEGFLAEDPDAVYPACTAGARQGPPEDCGGVDGYRHMLEVLADPKHPERKEFIAWLGGEYDPDGIDLEGVNETLSYLDDYIDDWFQAGEEESPPNA